jgi:RimJ/RimL family protein N-acetyltransferase
MKGRYVQLERLEPSRHADSLWREVGGLEKADYWRWMADGPFSTRPEFDENLAAKTISIDPLYYAVVVNGEAVGHASFLRIEPKHRVIEVGGLMFGPSLQRTRAATEAIFLMATHAFEVLGYRRLEWKCNHLNEPSRRAALRFGFTFEGIFRQHMIVKGVNRDTAWYSILDSEWPDHRAEFERWLDPANFDALGLQKTPLTLSKVSVAK